MAPQQTPDPQNRFRTRGLIQRGAATPAPTVSVPTPSEED
jgi:hypothetical protein